LPAWVIMVATLMLPILLVLVVSFATRGAYGGFEWQFSGASYREMLLQDGWSGELEFNPQYLVIIERRLYLAALTTLICAVISFPVAYFVAQPEGPKSVKNSFSRMTTETLSGALNAACPGL
jgi:spermidine/putrescine transport system permease protein